MDGGQIVSAVVRLGKGNIFFNAKWQFCANALYQLPAGFEVGASLFGRQGYRRAHHPAPDAGADGGTLRALATADIDDQRYDDLWNLDLRLAKTLKLGGRASLADQRRTCSTCSTATSSWQRNRQANSGTFCADRRDHQPARSSASACAAASSQRVAGATRPRGAPPGPFVLRDASDGADQ